MARLPAQSNTVADVVKALKEARSAVVIPHEDPDGDSLGAAIALGLVVEKNRGEVHYFSRDKIGKIYDFLPRIDRFTGKLPPKGPADVGIVCDCGDAHRIGKNIKLKELARRIINIDHHLDNGLFGDINLIQLVSSTAEIVYGICQKMRILTPEIATCIYTGIMMDTGNFRYDNTTSETLRIASELAGRGAKTFQIASAIYERQNWNGLKILGRVISEAELHAGGKVAVGVLTPALIQELGGEQQEIPQIVDVLRSIDGVDVGILFRPINVDEVKVNFRSKHQVNVQAIAKKFGGGGHAKASACVTRGALLDVKKRVLEEVCKQFQL